MNTLRIINSIITAVFLISYLYQFAYIPLTWLLRRRRRKKLEGKPNNFAVLICARNESGVIADLLRSLKRQTYDMGSVTVFVMADNCTDQTAAIARDNGAIVYERQNTQLVGKGYALEELIKRIKQDNPDGFDGYFVFDADNILEPDYIERMNETFSSGEDIITSYRNSKNYGDNWISAGYALWFLRESRYLNHARSLLGTSCAVSGTGFLFSRKVADEIGDWPYHLLTEDIEFSIDQIIKGKKIAFCERAVLYDEQPKTFIQSWRQRKRWSKGYIQVFSNYGKELIKGILKGSFSCYDMAMSIMPAFILSAFSIVSNVILGVWGASIGDDVTIAFVSIGEMLFNMYLTLFVIGMLTTVTEWKNIRTSNFRKIFYIFTFPLFMFTYVPIAISAFFSKTEWKPIDHSVSAEKAGFCFFDENSAKEKR